MQALICEALSEDLSGVSVAQIASPALRPGAVRVALRAAAFNFPDLLMTRGGYQFRPELPFVLGTEGCGVITETGDGVDPAWQGQRVVVTARQGCMAGKIVVPVEQVRAAPAALDDASAAAFTVTGLTAQVGLITRGRLQTGETVLVLGAGSGVSLAAIDVAHARGARVIAAASSDAKLAAARAKGVAHAIVTPRGGLAAADLKLAIGGTVDVVYDPLGGVLAEPAVRCMAWRGRYLVIGFASGTIPSLPLNLALLKGIEIVGVRAGEYGRRDPAAHAAHLAAIDQLAASGLLRPVISSHAMLGGALAQLRAMAAGSLVGKAVVQIS